MSNVLHLPWNDPDSIYEDAGPPFVVEFKVGEHQLVVNPTDDVGIHTGRRRYGVKCMSCGLLLHRGTTSPRCLIEGHLVGNNAYAVKLVG